MGEGLLTEQYVLKEAVSGKEGRGPCFGPDSLGPNKDAIDNIRCVPRVSSASRAPLVLVAGGTYAYHG